MKIILLIMMFLFSWEYNSVNRKLVSEEVETGFYFISKKESDVILKCDYQNKYYYIDPKPILKTANFKTIELRKETWPGLKWTYSLIIWLDDKGGEKWEEATTRATNDRLEIVFILDNEIITVLGFFNPITNGAAAIFGEHLSKEILISIKEKIGK